MSGKRKPYHRTWPMVRPRIAIEMQNSWDSIPPADQQELLQTWRDFMAADCMNELTANNWRRGMSDEVRFSEKHGLREVTFAWRSLLIGYWLGKAAQDRKSETAQHSTLEAIQRSFSDEY